VGAAVPARHRHPALHGHARPRAGAVAESDAEGPARGPPPGRGGVRLEALASPPGPSQRVELHLQVRGRTGDIRPWLERARQAAVAEMERRLGARWDGA
jgi:hypothetical protein